MKHAEFSELLTNILRAALADDRKFVHLGNVVKRRRKWRNSVRSTYRVHDPEKPTCKLACMAVLIPSTWLNNKRSR